MINEHPSSHHFLFYFINETTQVHSRLLCAYSSLALMMISFILRFEVGFDAGDHVLIRNTLMVIILANIQRGNLGLKTHPYTLILDNGMIIPLVLQGPIDPG